ncbi:DUF2017 family protein [Actinokineospora guangxiensis]|uniref:DUF2017 family protein n=1 Tax=Actinokineospora guangxiensis TaxID=1490288 RepID=A0ABW0EPT4_9PSEU
MTADISEDYFDAAPAADGVVVRMSANVAATLAHRVERLARFLETGEVDAAPGGLLRRRTTAEDVIRRMYPDVYPDRAAADGFRQRHSAALGDSRAARALVFRCSAQTQHVLSREEAEGWIGALGLVRFLTAERTGRGGDAADLVWFSWAQEALVGALHPDWLSPPTDPR